MKRISTAAAKQKNNLQDQRLTIGLDRKRPRNAPVRWVEFCVQVDG